MNLMEIVKEAQAALNYLKGKPQDDLPTCPGQVELVIELARAAASIATTEEYRQSVKAVSEAYTKSVEPPPSPPVTPMMRTPEEIREEVLNSQLREIKRLEELANAAEGPICPLTLIGEYPRECLGDKCMWNGKSVNDCVAHVLIRGGDISIKEKGPSP